MPRKSLIADALRAREGAAARQGRGERHREAERADRADREDDDRRPHLRLVRPPEGVEPAAAAVVAPIQRASDPRWVLAVRTAGALQGAVLPPERRQALIELGRSFGLSVFDANLVIAIVQDQARRGRSAEHCPAAGEAQLAMIPLPEPVTWRNSLREALGTPRARLAAVIGALAAAELALLAWLI